MVQNEVDISDERHYKLNQTTTAPLGNSRPLYHSYLDFSKTWSWKGLSCWVGRFHTSYGPDHLCMYKLEILFLFLDFILRLPLKRCQKVTWLFEEQQIHIISLQTFNLGFFSWTTEQRHWRQAVCHNSQNVESELKKKYLIRVLKYAWQKFFFLKFDRKLPFL